MYFYQKGTLLLFLDNSCLQLTLTTGENTQKLACPGLNLFLTRTNDIKSILTAACSPLCLDASSSPPRWDTRMRRAEVLPQACVEKDWCCECRDERWNEPPAEMLPLTRSCWRPWCLTPGQTGTWACWQKTTTESRRQTWSKGRSEEGTGLRAWRRSVLHSPLSRPGSSFSFLLCDSSGRRKRQKSC